MWIKDRFTEIFQMWKVKMTYKKRIRHFKYAKALAEMKHKTDNKRYYVFIDPVDGGYLVLNKDQTKRVNVLLKSKLNFIDALYMTS